MPTVDPARGAATGRAGTKKPTAATPTSETRPETNHIPFQPIGSRITWDESAMKIPTPAKCTQASDDRPARARPLQHLTRGEDQGEGAGRAAEKAEQRDGNLRGPKSYGGGCHCARSEGAEQPDFRRAGQPQRGRHGAEEIAQELAEAITPASLAVSGMASAMKGRTGV